jgi:catechol 2,3-dioxygenase-like lactoylglutathione lyase family enzyme
MTSDSELCVGQIHHAVLNVRDIDVSLPFYRDVLGLHHDGSTKVGGAAISRLTRIPAESRGRNAFLSAGHGMGRVELVEWKGAGEEFPAERPRGTTAAKPGYALLAFLLREPALGVLYERVRNDYVCWSDEPVDIVVADRAVRAFIVEDPDGNPLEFFSLPD